MRRLALVACALVSTIASATLAGQAAAEPAVGIINGTNVLATFDTATPSKFTSVTQVTGLAAGERLVDVDFRYHPNGELNPLPASQLFGVGIVGGATDAVRLYTIDRGTGVATQIGTSLFTVTNGDVYGIDFNPTGDRIRVVNDGDENFRINPNNGARADSPTNDTDLNPASNRISGIAYDRVNILIPPIVGANTTAYGISVLNSSLVTIGGINQSPSPNGGTIMNSKALGVTLAASSPAGFDISPSGTAFAALVSNSTSLPGLYTVNLVTGAATLVGQLPERLSGLAIVPPIAPPPPAEGPDVTPPTVSLKGVSGSLSLSAFLKGVKAKVTPSESAKLDGVLLAAAKSARLASFNLTLATKSLELAAGQRTLKLKPSKRLVGQPRKAFKARLQVTATDAAGNAKIVTKTIKVKPSPRHHRK